jgi:hypothetical protein
LYEFCRIPFQKQLCAALQYALLPLLEYAAELYGPPPDVFNGKLPSITGRKLHYKSERHNIESESILHHILNACRKEGEKTEEKNEDQGGDQEGDRKGEEKKKGSPVDLWKVTIDFSVPIHRDHEFWRKPSLTRINETAEENSTLLQVFAFASSEQEAISLAVMKLMHLIKLLREILRRRKETEDMKLTISKLIGKTITSTFPDMNDDTVLKIGAQLFKFHLGQEYGTRMRDRVWLSMTTLIGEAFKECSAELQSLLKYYLVILTLVSVTHIDISYDSRRATY